MPRRALAVLLALVSLTLRATAWAAPASFDTSPPPSWIAPVEPIDDEDATSGASHGRRYLLYSSEVRLGNGRQEAYYRLVQRITNESGLQAASQVDIEFDPSFETLTIHGVVVRRGSEVLDRLDRGAIRLVQREPDLEAQVYDGRVSAVLFLNDLRVGDVVDCAYTIRGADPTLQGRYASSLPLGAPEPMGRLHARVLAPRDGHLRFTALGPDVSPSAPGPATRSLGDEVEYVWDLSHVKAYTAEPDAPPFFAPFPFLEISEFASWKEVATLGSRLFDVAVPHSGGVADWVNRARSEARSPDAFMMRALRFVQDEVRYVGIEVGMSRRRPTDPGVVFDRRYGDCKDKAALLVTMLRLGGVNAEPALVHSSRGRALDAWAPSLTAFDHAIVKVTTSSGTYWLDPTLALQGGGADRLKYAPFERALALDADSEGLDTIAPEPADDPSPLVHDVVRVVPPGTPGETQLDSERIYRGALADSIRATFRARSRDQLRKDYLQLYQSEFPAIREAGELEISDDRERDVLRVATHFAIPGFWKEPEGANPYRAEIQASVIERALQRPSTTDRSAPLGLPYPLRMRYEVRLELPFDMNVTPETAQADAPALHVSFASAYAHRELSYDFEVVTRASAVAAADLPAHVAAVDKARAMLVRSLTYRPAPLDGPNWLWIAIVGVSLPLLGWGVHRAYRYDPAPAEAASPDPRWAKFGGWLNVLGVGILLRPFFTLSPAIKAGRVLFSRAVWTTLTTYGLPSSPPAAAPLIVVELYSALVLTAYGVALIPMFLRKRRAFPFHFTVYAVGVIAVQIVDVVWASAVLPAHDGTRAITGMFWSLVWALIWITYLRQSQRARSTFVN